MLLKNNSSIFWKINMYELKTRWKVEKYFRPSLDSQDKPNKGVEWLVHHIPKTAGTSLRKTFENAFGVNAVFGVYLNTGQLDLTAGKPIWTPRNAKVLFGHVQANAEQSIYYPNAKRLAWVRDPLERLWSNIGHTLKTKQPEGIYNYLKTNFLDKGIDNIEVMIETMLKDNVHKGYVEIYSQYFRHMPIEKFDFIGSVHRNREDLDKLQEILGVRLVEKRNNVLNKKQQYSPKLKSLQNYLQREYEIVADYL
ncbi:hypothetical protein [Alteromonas sp. ASW11-130]|uniref:hypothetical protein n=1 Tax=Alteromonas sp. ASW11-130 TaxID=3015775 RepID=UPI002241C6E6|nr:hypothetical protein [Alteromonas sp. ASW11-130]MCW8090684.1 hypothetical protein [Alteromonas sp. ASW11-130]